MPATAHVDVSDLIRKGWAKRNARIARAREGLADFGPMVVRDEEGQFIEYAEVHLQWIWHVTYCWNRKLHAAIWAPWGHGKTSSLVVPLTCWLVGRNPQARLKVVCAGDELASARVQGAKSILESPEYAEVFPLVRPGRKWTDHQVFVERAGDALDPTLHARGVETKGIGGRADFLLFDDVVDDMNSQEFLQRQKIKRRVHQKWMSRLDPERGRALWVCTPWHVDDASHELMDRVGWCTLVQPIHPDLDRHEPYVVGAGPDYQLAVADMQAAYEEAQRRLSEM